jgi:hypothetical protein
MIERKMHKFTHRIWQASLGEIVDIINWFECSVGKFGGIVADVRNRHHHEARADNNDKKKKKKPKKNMKKIPQQ